ncbi:MAG: ATP-dependent helicase HrpB [Gemmatimonadota bacterium]
MSLPIDEALPRLGAALGGAGAAVLEAPPGAGKTTRVPLALLDAEWLGGRTIVMLEPRRLAARAAAHYMARLLDEPVGRTVGYRVRLDTRVSAATRIEVVTEGVLTRMLQEDPALEPAGLVIFDEFHERSLHADLGLALTLVTRSVLRPDLRILVMSATLDGAAVAPLLGDAPTITSEGRAWPVDTRYRPPRRDQRVEDAVASAVLDALAEEEGDVLVFLPGAGEIARVKERLDAHIGNSPLAPSTVRLYPLHGTMSAADQDAAIAPSPPGQRKVVLATSIAETSLTIDGIRVVIDSGLMRVPRFSPRTGMTRLETVRVTRDAADQRRGRAGRTGPGICYRLWAAHDDAGLVPRRTPEIFDADLAPLALDLAAAGVPDPSALRWLTPPPAAAFAQARELLRELGAIDPRGRITAHGRRMAALPLHPRLAHMLLRADELGAIADAADLAALLTERDIARGLAGPPDPDIAIRLEALQGRGPRSGPGWEIDRTGLERARREAVAFRAAVRGGGATARAPDGVSPGLLLALAYPDRIAQRRPGQPGRFLLRNGRGASLSPAAPLAQAGYLVAAALDDAGSESRIQLAAALEPAELEAHFGGDFEREDVIAWDGAAQAVAARRRVRLGALVLRDAPLADPEPEAVTRALLGAIRSGELSLPWSDAARRIRERLAFLHRLDPDWPDVSDEALMASLDAWLAPSLTGLRRKADVERLDLGGLLLQRLTWQQRAALDELAPDRITVPSGSRIAIDYTDPEAPVLPVRLQEVFGWMETPRIGGGKVPLTLHLLSPAYRPVQVTRDLAGFWRGTYFEVRKDLRGRYPKHHWPEDPSNAEAVRGVKRK